MAYGALNSPRRWWGGHLLDGMANRAASKLPPMARKNGYAAYLRDSTPSTMARRREELKNHG
jgi:hypothetical protein